VLCALLQKSLVYVCREARFWRPPNHIQLPRGCCSVCYRVLFFQTNAHDIVDAVSPSSKGKGKKGAVADDDVATGATKDDELGKVRNL